MRRRNELGDVAFDVMVGLALVTLMAVCMTRPTTDNLPASKEEVSELVETAKVDEAACRRVQEMLRKNGTPTKLEVRQMKEDVAGIGREGGIANMCR